MDVGGSMVKKGMSVASSAGGTGDFAARSASASTSGGKVSGTPSSVRRAARAARSGASAVPVTRIRRLGMTRA